ncbi:MAG: hypothetical protein ACLGI9_18825, partial [Thermoanaerobaculia bacterium]
MKRFFGLLLVTLSTTLAAQTPGTGVTPCSSPDDVCLGYPACSSLHGTSCTRYGAQKTCTLPTNTEHKC